MRIAVITDAHANLPALEAALRVIDREGCDLLIHTGDAIGIGPHPREVLEVLLKRPSTRLVMGNHDEWFAKGLPIPQPSWMSDEELAHQRWTHAQLNSRLREKVAKWPHAVDVRTGSLQVTCHHYGLDEDDLDFAPIVKDPMPTDLDHLFRHEKAPVVFYGHHHPASDVQGRARYVNPGALGCGAEAVARYAILTVAQDGTWELQLRSEPYDRSEVIADYERRQVPARETILRIFHGQSG